MKYKNNIQEARRKYLGGEVLPESDQGIINKDLQGKDYTYFQSRTDSFLIPEKYSADSTYQLINNRITGKKKGSLPFIRRYAKYAAAIAIIALISVFVYKDMSPPAIIYASTSYGERKEIVLPDGSTVILNSLSNISYPEKMNGSTREVQLEGEAYFDVAKDPEKTFIVKTKGLDIRVLGTKFNIDAYENEEFITTSLFEGAVSVHLDNGYTGKLKAGEQAVFRKKEAKFEVQQPVNIQKEISWQTGMLTFENESLSSILQALAKEHDINFNIADEQLKNLRVTAQFASDKPVDEVLAILAESADFNFSKQGKNYKITAR